MDMKETTPKVGRRTWMGEVIELVMWWDEGTKRPQIEFVFRNYPAEGEPLLSKSGHAVYFPNPGYFYMVVHDLTAAERVIRDASAAMERDFLGEAVTGTMEDPAEQVAAVVSDPTKPSH